MRIASHDGQQASSHRLTNNITTMTNGSPTTATVATQHHSPTAAFLTTQNLLLNQMFAENPPLKPYLSVHKTDSRQTRIKHSPDGAVQITYKKMVNTQPNYTPPHPIFILPKTTAQICSASYTSSFVNASPNPCSVIALSNGIYRDSGSNRTPICPPMGTPATNTNSISPNNFTLHDNGPLSVTSIPHTGRCTSTNKLSHMNGFRTSNSLTISLPKMSNKDTSLNFTSTLANISHFNQTQNVCLPTQTAIAPSACTAMPLVSSPSATTYTPPQMFSSNDRTIVQNGDSMTRVVSSPSTTTYTPPQIFSSNDKTVQNGDPLMRIVSCPSTTTYTPPQMFSSNDKTVVHNGDPMMSSGELSMDLDNDLLSSLDMNSFEKELRLLKERMTDLPVVTDLDKKLFDSNSDFLNSSHCIDDIEMRSSVDMHVSPVRPSVPVTVETNTTTPCSVITIIDVSPETASLNGGSKVILVGSWNAKNARYQCKFGDVIVDAELIQNGVLKCYSPSVESPCNVKLCVLINDVVASNSVDFRYTDPTSQSSYSDLLSQRHDWLYITNENLKLTLKERFSSISEILAPYNSVAVNIDPNTENFEDQLIDLCKKLIVIDVDITFDYSVKNTMTLLHISAALGYLKLIQFLINWVETSANTIIETEASPTKPDEFSMLPIMWSAARGHFNTSCVLLQWHEATIQERDICGCTAIDLARECGHDSLVDYLERLRRKSLFSRDNSDANSPKSQHTPLNSSSSDGYPKPVEGSPSLRTLGRTLAHIQSILKEETERGEASDLDCSDDEGSTSLFESSYSPKSSSSGGVLSINPPDQSPSAHQSPFNRQIRETAEFCEFFYQAKKIEKDFAELTLTDEEQEELYRAANVIQTAYKTYKERRQRRDQELSAAVLIQSYYRRYKQYAAFKKMQKGALVIQSQYRAHREKARRKCHAASVIQSYYRKYKQRKTEDRLQLQADRNKSNRYLAQISKRFSQEIPDIFLNDINDIISSSSTSKNQPTPLSCAVSLHTHLSES